MAQTDAGSLQKLRDHAGHFLIPPRRNRFLDSAERRAR